MQIKTVFMCILFTLGLSLMVGCGKKGWFRDRSQDYGEAKSYPSLKIPPSIQAETFSPEYQIPDA